MVTATAALTFWGLTLPHGEADPLARGAREARDDVRVPGAKGEGSQFGGNAGGRVEGGEGGGRSIEEGEVHINVIVRPIVVRVREGVSRGVHVRHRREREE